MAASLPIEYRTDELKRLIKNIPDSGDLKARYEWASEISKHAQALVNHSKNALFNSLLTDNGKH